MVELSCFKAAVTVLCCSLLLEQVALLLSDSIHHNRLVPLENGKSAAPISSSSVRRWRSFLPKVKPTVCAAHKKVEPIIDDEDDDYEDNDDYNDDYVDDYNVDEDGYNGEERKRGLKKYVIPLGEEDYLRSYIRARIDEDGLPTGIGTGMEKRNWIGDIIWPIFCNRPIDYILGLIGRFIDFADCLKALHEHLCDRDDDSYRLSKSCCSWYVLQDHKACRPQQITTRRPPVVVPATTVVPTRKPQSTTKKQKIVTPPPDDNPDIPEEPETTKSPTKRPPRRTTKRATKTPPKISTTTSEPMQTTGEPETMTPQSRSEEFDEE